MIFNQGITAMDTAQAYENLQGKALELQTIFISSIIVLTKDSPDSETAVRNLLNSGVKTDNATPELEASRLETRQEIESIAIDALKNLS